MNSRIITIPCPECQRAIGLDNNLVVGQQTTCQFCNTDLIVTWLFPVSLDCLETKEPVSACQEVIDSSLGNSS